MLYRGKKYPGRETERFQRVFFRPSFNTLLTRLAHRAAGERGLANATFRPSSSSGVRVFDSPREPLRTFEEALRGI